MKMKFILNTRVKNINWGKDKFVRSVNKNRKSYKLYFSRHINLLAKSQS